MAEDKTFTQEEVNAMVGKARQEAKEVVRKEFDGWVSPDELQKQISALTDQVNSLAGEKENLQTQLSEKDGKIAKYEVDSVKTRVARELGLSYEAAEFLKGSTEEDIRKSGESLKGIGGKSVASPAYNSDPAPAGDEKTAAWAKMANDLFNN